MSRVRLAVVAAAAALMAACGGGSSAPAKKADIGPIKVGVLMAQLREERWQRDRDLIVAHIGELQPNTIVAHTRGRSRCTPRIEMTDEIRDIVRPRR